MVHSFLKNLKPNDLVDCVYHIVFKYSHPDTIRTAKNGNKYILLAIEDGSLSSNEKRASLFFYFDDESKASFLKKDSQNRTSYIKVRGECFRADQNNIALSTHDCVPADDASGIIFDTSNLYAFNELYKTQLLSLEGKTNVPLRHTSSAKFQEDFDLIEVGAELSYKRATNSPHDKYQINVFIKDIDDTFNVPAYLSPTMGRMADEGYTFSIVVTRVPPRDEEKDLNAGIRVTIKAKQNG